MSGRSARVTSLLLFVASACTGADGSTEGSVTMAATTGAATTTAATSSATEAAPTSGATGATTGAPDGMSSSATSGDATGSTGGPGTGETTGTPFACAPRSPTASAVCVEGTQLLVGRRVGGVLMEPQPYKIQGVGWSPTGIGESNTAGYSQYYIQYGAIDAPHIEGVGANTVKTYDPFARTPEGLALLDDLHARGIMVAMTVLAWHGDAGPKEYLQAVEYFKGHPAILMWIVGNEFNYNLLYGAADLDAATAIVNEAIDLIHAADPDHPVAVGHGEVPSPERYAAIPGPDLWAVNLYPALDLESRFVSWAQLSDKPMFVSEYGADAFDNDAGQEDQAAQAEATEIMTMQLMDHYSADDPSEPNLGGTIFVLTDEWWKADGSPDSHDNGGFPGAIHADGFSNEEWWGLMTVNREPRAAYEALKGLYGG